MTALKLVLTIVCTIPFVIPGMWLCSTAMEWLLDHLVPDDGSIIEQMLINPILAILAAFVVPSIFIAITTGIYAVFASLFGVL